MVPRRFAGHCGPSVGSARAFTPIHQEPVKIEDGIGRGSAGDMHNNQRESDGLNAGVGRDLAGQIESEKPVAAGKKSIRARVEAGTCPKIVIRRRFVDRGIAARGKRDRISESDGRNQARQQQRNKSL